MRIAGNYDLQNRMMERMGVGGQVQQMGGAHMHATPPWLTHKKERDSNDIEKAALVPTHSTP